jgi:hypothetical protein
MEEYSDSLVRLDRHPTRAALRGFGVALALLCFTRAALSLYSGGQPVWTGLAGCVAAPLAVFGPELLRGLYILLGVLSYPVRWLVAFSILALLYFVVITPVAWLFRLTRRVHTTGAQSAWHTAKPRGDKADYFRQF